MSDSEKIRHSPRNALLARLIHQTNPARPDADPDDDEVRAALDHARAFTAALAEAGLTVVDDDALLSSYFTGWQTGMASFALSNGQPKEFARRLGIAHAAPVRADPAARFEILENLKSWIAGTPAGDFELVVKIPHDPDCPHRHDDKP